MKEEIIGTPTVVKGFGLKDHLIALEVNQSCYVRVADYSSNVLGVTLSRLRKEGYGFISHKIKNGKKPTERIKVTRTA